MAVLYEVLSDADSADLFYVTDERPGITRRRRGKGFSYHHRDGTAVSPEDKARIEGIVIPRPGPTCGSAPWPTGTSRPLVETSGAASSTATTPVGGRCGTPTSTSASPTLPRACPTSGPGSTKTSPAGAGIEHQLSLRDRRLAAIVKACQDLPGEDLFGYLHDDGRAVDVTSNMVNDYLRSITGAQITAKHFRTWGGTVTAAGLLAPPRQHPHRLPQLLRPPPHHGGLPRGRPAGVVEAGPPAARFTRGERAVLNVLEARTS